MARTAATHTLVLPIAPERWRPPAAAIELDGLRLEPKPELHITLVGRVLGAELHAEFGDRAEEFIDAARRAHDWRFERSGHGLLLRKPFTEDGRVAIDHSLVELASLPAMTPFPRSMGRLRHPHIPLPPTPHPTEPPAIDKAPC